MSRPLSIPPRSPQTEREIRYRDFERILKLISRLGSPSEHEVFQCVKQLTKALQAVGLSWSDIAARIRELGLGGRKPPKKPKSWAEMSTSERLSWLEALKRNPAFEDERTWLIEKCDRYYLVPDPQNLAGLEMDDLILRARAAGMSAKAAA